MLELEYYSISVSASALELRELIRFKRPSVALRKFFLNSFNVAVALNFQWVTNHEIF